MWNRRAAVSPSPHRTRGQTFVIRLCVTLILAVAVAFLAYGGTLLVVSRGPERPEAFLVLASHEWERFPALVAVARNSPNAAVILTEPVRPTPENCAACGHRVGWLAELGIDSSRVVVLPRRVLNTYGEARAALEFCRQRSIRSLVVVTSPYHTRRALATFTTVFDGSGIRLGVYPAVAESGAMPRWWWWSPYDRWYVAYEWTGLAWYAVRYGVSPVPG